MTSEIPPKKLLDQVRDILRLKHYALSLNRSKRFILFHPKRYPNPMNSPEIEGFLTSLATGRFFDLRSQNGPAC
jgi:hypothetical protein